MSVPTPQLGHLTASDYELVYEPAEDSFILLDAIEADAEQLRHMYPTVCLEIGTGSGVVSAFLATVLGPSNTHIIGTDINIEAGRATQRTAAANESVIDCVCCDLLEPLRSRLWEKVDVLVMNPPYVPTHAEEFCQHQGERSLGGAWAGGGDGRSVMDRLLSLLPNLLSPNGVMYLVTVEQNRPQDIVPRLNGQGMNCQTILRRRAGRELLSVLRANRTNSTSQTLLSTKEASA